MIENRSVQGLVELSREREIRIVSLMHVGGDGWLKTLDFVPRSPAHLRNILEAGERADGSSLFAGLGIRPGASDIILKPRPETAFIDPFAPLPTLVVLAGHAGRGGEPLPESPDTIVQRAAARVLAETGVDLQAHGEIEYFLGKRAEEGDIYGAAERGYHATSPFVFGEDLRRRALAILAEIGVSVKYGHSEAGYIEAGERGARARDENLIWEQHEIELALTSLSTAADAVLITQWVLRKLAHKEGMRCSFDPILRKGHAGNGLHFHFSPVVGGRHVATRNDDGALSDSARWLIAGFVRFGGALMAFGNRAEGSLVRLIQGIEAPKAINWGDAGRGALVRIPIVAKSPDGNAATPPTIEFRLPDGSAHPHLLLAGAAQALVAGRSTPGLDELLARTSSSMRQGTVAVNAAYNGPGDGAENGSMDDTVPTPVPRSFAEIASALITHRAIFEAGDVFPRGLIDRVIERLRVSR